MTAQCKTAKRAAAPQTGDFVARVDPFASTATIFQRADQRDDDARTSACATLAGAVRLAGLLNGAQALARDWQELKTDAPAGMNAEKWAKLCILAAVGKAIGLSQSDVEVHVS